MNPRAKAKALLGLGVLLLAGNCLPAADSASAPTVQVVRAPGWSQGDAVKDGAAEFVILIEVARLGLQPGKGGLVGVGDRRGLFGPGAEHAMHQAVLHGVPVVKLATGGRVLPAPHGLFLDGSGLSEQEACTVLARCFEKFGPPPLIGEDATEPAQARLRTHLKRYQDEFTLAAGTRLAVR